MGDDAPRIKPLYCNSPIADRHVFTYVKFDGLRHAL